MNRTGRALLALLLSIGLVAAASFARRAFIDDDSSADNDPANAARVICAEELADTCATLARDTDIDVVVEPVFETIERLSAVESVSDADLWLTIDPLPALVDERRRVAGLDPIFERADDVARSPIVWAVRARVADALTRACRGTITWRCLAENADRPWTALGGDETWGRLRIGHDDPSRTGRGLLVIGQAAAHLLAPDIATDEISRGDFDEPAFREDFGRLEADGVPSDFLSGATDQSALEYFVGTNFAAADLVATTQADIDRGGSSSGFVVVTPQPEAQAGVVLAGTRSAPSLSDDELGVLADALDTSGWTTSPKGSVGLPTAGVLDALLDVWKETVQ